MLQRAAGNAYSWWWAGHIRTKQSKWLEQNLQDMEQKVESVLNLIQKDGDSFARRAEMYYRHRPELIAFIEETVRAYRALAERYDKLSTDLQKANTTIAAICPDQVPYDDLDEDYDFNEGSPKDFPQNTPPKTPKTPKTPKNAKNNAPKTIKTETPESGLTKEEALEEVDKIQKEILGMQTKKEFIKTSYESSSAQYLDTDDKINELQEKASSLQDEFQITKVIEDDEARNLMAGAALKSCEETLDVLQERQEKSGHDAKLEHQRIHEAKERLVLLRLRFETDLTDHPCVSNQDNGNESRESLEDLSKKPVTVSELADTIDKIVNKVISLESSVSSQAAFIDTLRTETDDLRAQIKKLEEENLETKIEINVIDESTKLEKKDDVNWQQMLLSGEEEKEKILLEEYITLLRNYKEMKKKLTEEEKRNQGNVLQVRQLKSAVDKRDNVIRILKERLKTLQKQDCSDDLLLELESEAVSAIEEKLRTDIDAILDENLDFWMRFSTTFHQIQKFKNEVKDLQEEIKKVKGKGIEGKSTELRSDIKPIYKHLKEIKNELTAWLDQSTSLKDELHKRLSNLSKIQEDIVTALKEGVEEEEIKFSTHQAAKFQGEILNMQQENNKVNKELQVGLDHVTALKHETEKLLERLEEEFQISVNSRSPSRSGIPLRSFIFGVKPKKHRLSLFACITHHKKFSAYKSF